jgi:hypothetical protein
MINRNEDIACRILIDNSGMTGLAIFGKDKCYLPQVNDKCQFYN